MAHVAAAPVVLALGSNRCHGRHGRPAGVLRAAAAALASHGVAAIRMSPILTTAPLGPSDRCFANAVLCGVWPGSARELLVLAGSIERQFGRRPGRRWGARVLDIDILAFGEAILAERDLTIPHPRMAERDFVIRPMLSLVPDWRHPASGLRVRHMAARLLRRRPVDIPRLSA